MPNWCANRLRVAGPTEEVSMAKALMEGSAGPSGYRDVSGPAWIKNNVASYGG